MLVTGHDPEQIAFGNTLTNDAHKGKSFHYMLSNPPYPIREEAQTLGTEGRFGAGLPRISDGQLLFLQHMISKMRDDETGSRIGIVMNGSPLFTGGANSGESEIRRWMLENDWVEAIVALPTDLFYNTGIQTYVWLLTNRKSAVEAREGPVDRRLWRAVLEIHAQVPRLQAPGNTGGGAQGDRPYLCRHVERQRRVRGILQDLRHHRLRIPRSPRRAALAAELPGGAGAYRTPEGGEGVPEAGRGRETAIQETLGLRLPRTVFTDREQFDMALTGALRAEGIKIAAPVRKVILTALSEQDEGADICADKNGRPEPDMLRLQAFRVEQKEEGAASLGPGVTETLTPISEFAAKPYTEEEERSLSEIIKAFNDRHGTAFTREDFIRFEQVNREIMDDDLTEMLRNNPPDVVFSAFSEAFFKGAIKMFQRDNEMKSIVLSDAQARDRATRHFFNRALREVREGPQG